MMYYRYLFFREDITPAEGIVYSELIYQSFSCMSEVYDEEGRFDDKSARAQIQDSIDLYGEARIVCCPINITKLADKVEMSLPTIRKTIQKFKRNGILKGNYIQCPLGLFDSKYFRIPKGTNLKGRQLVFYGYLLNLQTIYKGPVSDWAYKMRKDCGIAENYIYFLIHELSEKGWVKRLENNKLAVYKPKGESHDSPLKKTKTYPLQDT